MPVHIQRGGHIAVTQPRLDVLDITAALTERVYRAVSQIMEPAGQTMGLDYPPEMVGYAGFDPVPPSVPTDNPA